MVENNNNNDDDSRPRSKKLGEHLLISKGAISHAVEKQINAFVRGEQVDKFGESMVKSGTITREDLDSSISRQRKERLSICPLFASMTPADLSALSKKFTEVSVPPGEQFIVQGEDDPSLYIIASGLVEVYRADNAGNEITIARVGEGGPIGEMGYFTGGKRTASVRAITPTQLLRADYKNLTHYFEHVPRVALAFTRVVETRQKELEQITGSY